MGGADVAAAACRGTGGDHATIVVEAMESNEPSLLFSGLAGVGVLVGALLEKSLQALRASKHLDPYQPWEEGWLAKQVAIRQ